MEKWLTDCWKLFVESPHAQFWIDGNNGMGVAGAEGVVFGSHNGQGKMSIVAVTTIICVGIEL